VVDAVPQILDVGRIAGRRRRLKLRDDDRRVLQHRLHGRRRIILHRVVDERLQPRELLLAPPPHVQRSGLRARVPRRQKSAKRRPGAQSRRALKKSSTRKRIRALHFCFHRHFGAFPYLRLHALSIAALEIECFPSWKH